MIRRLFILFLSAALAMPHFALALTPNDRYYSDQWYLPQISAPDAWNETTGSNSIVVAVLDTGIDLDHPDLVGNIWTNSGEIPGNALDDDSNGFVDDVYGWDFIDNDKTVTPDLTNGASEEAIIHGTMVAGIIGAVGNNRLGAAGVNWHVRIMSVRVLDNIGSGSAAESARALDYAVANGADVINFSLSGDAGESVFLNSLQRAYDAGVVVVTALGNDEVNTEQERVYPACFGIGEAEDLIIGVAATDATDNKATFSNYGSNCTDISAPGDDFLGLSYNDPNAGFDSLISQGWGGTSMAAPLVSGAVALLLAQYPDLSVQDIQNILQLSVDPLNVPTELQGKMGTGRLNIARALEIAAEYSAASSSTPETTTVFIRGESLPTVYALVGSQRYAVINALTYFTYEESFEAIEIIPDNQLANYQLAGLVLPQAGVVLVKIQSDPRVYALQVDPENIYAPQLREIADESVASAMYGSNWADYVIDVEPSFFTKFGQGLPISSPESVDTGIMKTREQLSELSG